MKPFNVLSALSLILIVSCNDQVDNQPIYPILNWVSFSSDKQFELITNKILLMTDQELNAWEEENSFVSYRTVLNQANKEWATLNASSDEAEFLKRYEDVLSIQDSTLVPSISIMVYQSIVNREGIYETNGYINRVVGDYIITGKKEDYDKLIKIKSSHIDDGRVTIFQDIDLRIARFTGLESNESARTNSTCTTYLQAEYYYNPSGCRDDRKAFILARSYIALSTSSDGDRRQPRVEIKVWGTIRNGWCNWDGYYTLLEYRNVSFMVMGWTTQNGVSTPTLFSRVLPDYAPTNERTHLPWDQPIGDAVLNQIISASAFTNLHAEGKSRGIDNNWAIIDCR